MTVLRDDQLASVLRRAGFTGNGLVIGIAVGLAESGGRTDATNKNTNGSIDTGIMQINSIHRVLIAGRDLTNPDINASLAYQISGRGTNWKPWSTYNNGSYRKFMARAAAAAGMPNADYSASGSGSAPATAASDPTAFLSVFTNGGMWARVGVAIAGAVMFMFGLWQISGIGGAAVSIASKVVKI